MSGPALSRRERQLLRAIERDLQRDEELDRQFREAHIPRRRGWHRGHKHHNRGWDGPAAGDDAPAPGPGDTPPDDWGSGRPDPHGPGPDSRNQGPFAPERPDPGHRDLGRPDPRRSDRGRSDAQRPEDERPHHAPSRPERPPPAWAGTERPDPERPGPTPSYPERSPGFGRGTSRRHAFGRLIREHALILLIPLCAVMLAAAFGGAPGSLVAAAAVIWTVTLWLLFDRIRNRRRRSDGRGRGAPRIPDDPGSG